VRHQSVTGSPAILFDHGVPIGPASPEVVAEHPDAQIVTPPDPVAYQLRLPGSRHPSLLELLAANELWLRRQEAA
jgi:hypothetical protein